MMMMIEKDIVKRFLNKYVGVVRSDNNKDFFSKGKLTEVTDKTIIIKFHGQIQAISIDSLINIREMKQEEVEQ